MYLKNLLLAVVGIPISCGVPLPARDNHNHNLDLNLDRTFNVSGTTSVDSQSDPRFTDINTNTNFIPIIIPNVKLLYPDRAHDADAGMILLEDKIMFIKNGVRHTVPLVVDASWKGYQELRDRYAVQ